MAQVPVIVDGRFKLFESHAILRYLASVFPGVADHWYPADLFSRAKIESILDWHHSNLHFGAGTFVYYTALAPFLGFRPRPETTKHAEKSLMQSLARIESVWLKGDAKFLLGRSHPSIADLILVCSIMHLEVLDDDMRNKFLGGRKRILAWIDKVKKATSPHFEEAHVFLLEVKAQMQSKAAAAATAAKQGGSEASSELKFSSKL